jgi:signal transduction histidine kinase
VATLVARQASLPELAAAIAEEIAHGLGVATVTLDRYEPDASLVIASHNEPGFPVGTRWSYDQPSLGRTVRETGRPARVDDEAALVRSAEASARTHVMGSTAGVPIIVEGGVWGVICVGAEAGARLPDETETRLARFAELLTTAIANAHASDELRQLAEEQAALRRLATLAAEGAGTDALLAAVVRELARVVRVPMLRLERSEPDGSRTTLAAWVAEGQRASPHVVRVPIVVEEEFWGVIAAAAAPGDAGADDLERRLSRLSEPVAVAIGRVEAEDRVQRLAAEQAALGRVATLVATGTASHELLDVVAQEVAGLLGLPAVTVERRERGGETSVRGSFGPHDALAVDVATASIRVDGAVWGTIRVRGPAGGRSPVGTDARLAGFTQLIATAIAGAQARDSLRRLVVEQAALRRTATRAAESVPLEELFAGVADDLAALLGGAAVEIARGEAADSAEVVRTPAAASVPIVVDGAAWGSLCARAGSSPLPPDTAARLERFAELVATAISKSEARDEVRALLAEQAALRRVATLVAEGGSAEDVFSAVTAEVSRLLHVPVVTLDRYEGSMATVVLAATYTDGEPLYPVGSRWPLDGPSVAAAILETGRSARIDDYTGLPGTTAAVHHPNPRVSSFGVPIIVAGRVWGMMGVGSSGHAPLPASTEARLTRFTELVATAVSNATARSEIVDSRARLLVAGDEARSRIGRRLHEGAEQRLLGLARDLEALRASTDDSVLDESLTQVGQDISSVVERLRELSLGLHPAILGSHGLGPSIEDIAARCPIPVELDVELERRPPEPVEIGIYYVVSEALTNAAKHSHASTIRVSLGADRTGLRASVSDDGVGGAEPAEGSGLAGLADRVVALGGRFALESPPGRGTRIDVRLPCTSFRRDA